MGRIWGSPDVGLKEPFISVFPPGLLMRLLPRSVPRLLGFHLRARADRASRELYLDTTEDIVVLKLSTLCYAHAAPRQP